MSMSEIKKEPKFETTAEKAARGGHPNRNEKIDVYERLLHDIQFHREVTMNPQMVAKLLDKIGDWSYSHRRGNGECDEKEQQTAVDKAFWNLDKR
jgi:hypothetical protein